MTTAPLPTCNEHVWERHLQVHNKLERVVRVCMHCGCVEVCWSPPPIRRKSQLRRAGQVISTIATPLKFGI